MKRLAILAAIVLIGALLRTYLLTTVPPSLSHDESAIAYSAYSVLKTGKDEYGVPFPLLFRSFDDYKLPGMVYATVPFVAMFGKSTIAARLPSAVFGILAIIVMYGLAREFLGSKTLRVGPYTVEAAAFPTLLFAVQPWHINFSRQLFESNGAVFWFMLGTYFLLRSRRDYGLIIWSGLSYVMALYFYYSVRLVIPFIVGYYAVHEWRRIWKYWKITLIAGAVSLLCFLPMGKEMLSPGGWQRIRTVSVTNDKSYIARKDRFVSRMGTHPTVIQKIIYNRRVALGITVLENYWKNISPRNLFSSGTGTYGALYPFEIILIPLGILVVFTLPVFQRTVILLWLICGFFPGAFSTNQPNTLRTLVAAPPFAILSGFGVLQAISIAKRRIRSRAPAVTLGILLLFFLQALPGFLFAYFVDNPTNNALAFGDGNKQMVEYVTAHEAEYTRVYISGYYWRPYIFMLYWGNIPPRTYQAAGSRDHIGKYYFTAANWDTNGIKLMDPAFDPMTLPHDGNTLFVLSAREYETHRDMFQKIASINGARTKDVFVAAVLP